MRSLGGGIPLSQSSRNPSAPPWDTPSRKSCGISGRGRLFDRIVDRNLLVRCTENAFRCLWVTYSLFVGWIFCGKRAILFYVVLYNRMMAYVEHHAYPNSDNEERDEK